MRDFLRYAALRIHARAQIIIAVRAWLGTKIHPVYWWISLPYDPVA